MPTCPALGHAAVGLWARRLRELAHLDFGGGYAHRALAQIAAWLSGPGEILRYLPFNAAGVVIVVYVTLRGRGFDPWLRLIGAAVLAEYAVDFSMSATPAIIS